MIALVRAQSTVRKRRLKTSSGWNSCQGNLREITAFACKLCTSLWTFRRENSASPLFETFFSTSCPDLDCQQSRFNCQRIIAQLVHKWWFFFFCEIKIMCLVLKNFFYTNQIIKGSNYEKWIIIYCWKITFLEILPRGQSIFVTEFD